MSDECSNIYSLGIDHMCCNRTKPPKGKQKSRGLFY